MPKSTKKLYVGKLLKIDITNRKILDEGTGSFSTVDKELSAHYSHTSFRAIEDVSWIPILKTEDGYFSPAHSRNNTVISYPFQSSSRETYNMDSYFNWPVSEGINYIFDSIDVISIDIESTPQSSLTLKKDNLATLTTNVSNQKLEHKSSSSFKVSAELIYSTKGFFVTPAIRYKIQSTYKPLNDWLKIAHAFRLYWVLQNDHVHCRTINIYFGKKLQLVTSLLSIDGYTDNTFSVQDSINPTDEINASLLLASLELFFNSSEGTIQQALYGFMAVRLSKEDKNLVDDPLRLIFSLDGFTVKLSKSNKTSSALKKKEKASIDSILKFVEDNKNNLEESVYDFYSKNTDQIYGLLSQKPFKEAVRTCFQNLNIDYNEHEDTITRLNSIRQTFVHGKNYDTQKIAKELFTHATHDISKNNDGTVSQISFGQKSGLVDDSYRMLREVYLAYLSKDINLAHAPKDKAG